MNIDYVVIMPNEQTWEASSLEDRHANVPITTFRAQPAPLVTRKCFLRAVADSQRSSLPIVRAFPILTSW